MNSTKQYRKKPIVVSAVLFDGLNHDEVADFCAPQPIMVGGNYTLVIPTLEGNMTAEQGDYIIKGVQGEFYPCKPDIFEATYDLADQDEGIIERTSIKAYLKKWLRGLFWLLVLIASISDILIYRWLNTTKG